MLKDGQTREQLRAADALAAVERVKEFSSTDSQELPGRYRSYVERLGPMILMNGLGQALATERAAEGPDAGAEQSRDIEKNAHGLLYKNISAWLCAENGIFPASPVKQNDILQNIVSHGQTAYVKAQGEALAWLVWHKKFCRAYLPKNEVQS